jgi:hypothetical protein
VPEPLSPGARCAALLLGVLLSAAGSASPPAGQAAPPAVPPAKPAAPPADESLFEFLGADDVGDVRWWDYLRKSAPRTQAPPPSQPPTQGTGQ